MTVMGNTAQGIRDGYMDVPWSYLPKQFAQQNLDAILESFREFVPTGDFTLGQPLAEFEAKFAAMIGTRHAIGVNSGTDALKISLKALGVGYGDEVITAANTFIATIGAIAEVGARPVLVDCTDNFCLDVDLIERAITEKTRAIMPVHFAGQMTDMPALMKLSERYKLPVIEDACQCILGEIKGKKSGTWGNTAGFSLHPLKNLNVWGDGGIIVTSDDALAADIRLLRNHGLINRDEVAVLGYNSRLDTLQAIVGNWLIEQIGFITDTRIRHADMLDQGLASIAQITLPPRYADRKLVYHLYMVFAERRDDLLAYCQARGVEAKVHYPIPVYLQAALRKVTSHHSGDFPVTDRHAASLISFPAHEHLTENQLDHIVETVRNFYRG